jgi:hypothetical protein
MSASAKGGESSLEGRGEAGVATEGGNGSGIGTGGVGEVGGAGSRSLWSPLRSRASRSVLIATGVGEGDRVMGEAAPGEGDGVLGL